MRKPNLSCLWLMLPVILIDRLTKAAARAYLAYAESAEVIPGVLAFTRRENRGISFSMLSGAQTLTVILTTVIIFCLLLWLVTDRKLSALTRSALALVAGGGLSNLFDRICYGFVTDMIEPLFVRFAVFNAADVFICVGAALAAISLFIPAKGGDGHG